MSVALQDGVPTPGTLAAGKLAYYSIRVTEAGRSLVVMVTPTTGDPDLYVSKKEPFPNSTNTDPAEQARAWGADAIVIDNAAVGLYYIGVEAAGNEAAVFTVIAASSKPHSGDDDDDDETTAPIQLLDGEPQGFFLAANASRNFLLHAPAFATAYTDLMVTFSLFHGDVEFMARHGADAPPTSVNATTAQWSSAASEMSFLWVAAPQPGYYLIRVTARGASSVLFSITAALDNTHVVLQNGVGVPGYLGTDEATYYKLTIPADTAVAVSLVSLYGDPNLYVNDNVTKPYPGPTTEGDTEVRSFLPRVNVFEMYFSVLIYFFKLYCCMFFDHILCSFNDVVLYKC